MRITVYLTEDHARLDALRETGAYEAFRAGLLRHIAIEEKVLFPAVRAARPDAVPEGIARLRADHARFAAILAVSPTPESVAELVARLAVHDALEEAPDGVYAACEAVIGDAVSRALAVRAREYPPVRVAAYRDWLRPDDAEVTP